MELTYWALTFNNGKEYIIQSKIEDIDSLLTHLGEQGLLFKDKRCVTLKKTESSEPLFIMSNNLFSIQKLKANSLANQTKIWSLV